MLLNDVHSALNPTTVTRVEKPKTLAELRAVVHGASPENIKISVAGGKHAMGGQQFLSDGLHVDCTALNRVLRKDCTRGLIEVEAGIMWPAIIDATQNMPHPAGGQWAIRQKQTGVDDVTLAGSVSVAAHGRGLLMQPISDDVESLVLVDATGTVIQCTRSENPELFALVIGGYGLFGLIYSVTLRLTQRQKLLRVVDVIELDDAVAAIYRRVGDGFLYGDFQYAIDDTGNSFMRKGVFACYRPAPADAPEPDIESDLPAEAWLKLLALAHNDKARAFKIYAGHYLQTDGNTYWSDTMQLSTYIPSYAEYLQQHTSKQDASSATNESLIIGEHYVPALHLLEFMRQARTILRQYNCEVIYGTLRAIQSDTTSYLAWARQDYVCVIFNLRTAHTAVGIARTADCFRALTDASAVLDGSYFLTYHRFASVTQLERSHPKMRQFFALKRQYDPQERFQSDWYLHYKPAFLHA